MIQWLQWTVCPVNPVCNISIQLKHLSDLLFRFINCDQVKTLCLQLDGSGEIQDIVLNHKFTEN